MGIAAFINNGVGPGSTIPLFLTGGLGLWSSELPGCDDSCAWIFDRITVWPQIRGGTRVEWTLHPNFRDPGPYTFQLQFGRTGNPAADDWTNVGLSVTDTYYAIDDSQRVYGKTQWTHYRLVLTTSVGVYISAPQPAFGVLDHRDWRRAREILRQESLRLRKEAGQEGYLLKRRLFGTVHEDCVDYLTREVKAVNCEVCYDTGFVGGYFTPMECVYAEQSRKASHEDLDAGAGRGTVNDGLRVAARMLAVPQLHEEDVWVDRDTDDRWYIHSIENIVEVRGVPLVLQVEMRLAPYSDVIYRYPIPGMTPG